MEMKYFTLKWWTDCQQLNWQKEELRQPLEQYEKYFASVRKQLPPDLITLTDSGSLHDATFLSLGLDTDEREARLPLLISIREEKKPMTEKKGTLLYYGVTYFGSTENKEYSLAGLGGHGDLGYDEVEVINAGLFEHRMLFSSGIEFTVRFSDFASTWKTNQQYGTLQLWRINS